MVFIKINNLKNWKQKNILPHFWQNLIKGNTHLKESLLKTTSFTHIYFELIPTSNTEFKLFICAN